jgi:signal transduction histidine kinase
VDGQWLRNGGLQGIPNTLTASMARDAAGRLWMGHVRSQISVVDGASLRRLGPEQGLKLGAILALTADGDAMWVGGEQGVALYRAGRFVTLAGEHGEAFAGVSGIARLPNGELWLNGAEGLYRISADQVRRWRGNSAAPVAFARFNAQDGMQGRAQQWRPLPSLLYAGDGQLWFATSGSVGTVDPAHLPHNPLPPPVEITSLHADGLRYRVSDASALHLPKGTLDLQLDFTALSLSMPERVRLRYRLVGWDHAWKEAVGRREAYYTNLAPGKYRFEVIAANEDGVWNTKGAALDMEIPPTFVQSIWFKLLLAATCLLILYAAYVLRIRYLTQLIQERTAERMRIARTLHDTLLQSMQALLLSFDAHSRHLKEGTPERRRLDQTLNLAEQLLVEGRDQIMDLRTAVSPEVLSLTLEEFGKGLAEHRTHAFQMRVAGTPRRLRPGVHEEVYAIGREALFNASRYAEATRIELELEYSASVFVLRIRDNGRGLDDDVAAAGGKPGHWGLSGMRERAAGIGAQLEIVSKLGGGIEITLTSPARRAY